ncbi:hypothetical protein BDW74DRAFT_182764 [Aspergillus multicolor]|uniref:uncharacterized protein n=1 Tax=Aspergillus multicolor TaxID=41759 RepID=UPI003CCD512B
MPDAMNITNTFCGIPPRSRKTTQLAVGSIFIVLTTVAIGLRLLGRPPFSPSFGIDDGIGIATYCTAMVDTVVMIQGANIGWGTDMWALTTPQITTQMKLFYIGILTFYASISLAKLSILFFYLRIFTTTTLKRATYGTIVLCTLYGLAALLTSILDCIPPNYFRTRFDSDTQGSCISQTGFKVMPPINIALDVLVMVLPLPALARLNLPLQKKVRVLCMFSVGIFIIIADILRITHLYHSITTYNITYNGGELSYFGVIEAGVSVICTCMPAIAALLKRVLPRWFGSSAKRSGSSPYPYPYRNLNTWTPTGGLASQSQRDTGRESAYGPRAGVAYSATAWGGLGMGMGHGNGNRDGNGSDIHLTLLPVGGGGTESGDGGVEVQRPQKALSPV